MANIVGVTACSTGIAHSLMAAEALRNVGRMRRHSIRIECQGRRRNHDPPSDEDIANANVFIRWPLCAWMTFLTLPAVAKGFVLTDAATAKKEGDRSISSAGLGLNTDPAFSIAQRTLHGGKQEGVELIEVDNGRMKVSVIPTRGMSILRVESGDVTLGWTSPVDQIVHPVFIDLDSRGGLGLPQRVAGAMRLQVGGASRLDDERLLTLHAAPASKVIVVDDSPPHRISVREE